MSSNGEHQVWTAPQLAARLAALKGVAPAPSCYVIWRETAQGAGPVIAGYELPNEPGRASEATFVRWLMQRDLAGAERLSVSVLVIREYLSNAGLIREGVLERRRGGVDGPCYGKAARIEFIGPARRLKRYQALHDGSLAELPATAEAEVPPPADEPDAEGFAGEDAAVYAYLGPDAVILDRRAPSLFEDLLGLSGIVHARRRDGAEIGCGVGWHGTEAFVLAADFPRNGARLIPPPDLEAAVVEAIPAWDLIRHETRLDDKGMCVIARMRGSQALVTIRRDAAGTNIEPYLPGRNVAGTEEQRQWLDYAEKYESRIILDVWRHGDGDEIAVLTADPDHEAWRHIIDADGIEVSRRSDNEAAAAALYRERVTAPPGPLAALGPDGTAPDGTVPDGTAPDGTVPDGTVPDAGPPAAEGHPPPPVPASEVAAAPVPLSEGTGSDAPAADAPMTEAPPSEHPPATAPAPGVAASDTAESDDPPPADSLLAKVRAYSRVTRLLRATVDFCAERAKTGNRLPQAALDPLHALFEPLTVLRANFSAGSLGRLIARAESGAMTVHGFAAALDDLVTRLRDELGLTRIVFLSSARVRPDGEPPFGPAVARHFPAAAYDIEEAVHCLASRRPTAAVLHAGRAMRHGLQSVEHLLATPPLASLTWAAMIAAVRDDAGGDRHDVAAALDRVRRVWREPGLSPAAKYTEEEAEAVLDSVASFMRALAARFDAREATPPG